MASLRGMLSGGRYKYAAIPTPISQRQVQRQEIYGTDRKEKLLKMSMGGMVFLVILYMMVAYGYDFLLMSVKSEYLRAQAGYEFGL